MALPQYFKGVVDDDKRLWISGEYHLFDFWNFGDGGHGQDDTFGAFGKAAFAVEERNPPIELAQEFTGDDVGFVGHDDQGHAGIEATDHRIGHPAAGEEKKSPLLLVKIKALAL